MKELSWRERGQLWFRLGIRLAIALLLILIVWKVIPPLVSLLMPFVIALVMAWLLNPLIKGLQKKLGASRGAWSLILVIIVMVVGCGVVGGLVYALVSQAISFFQNWQPFWSDTVDGMNGVTDALDGLLGLLPAGTHDKVMELIARGVDWLTGVIPGLIGAAAANVGSWALSVPGAVIGVVIFLMATYFLSADYPNIRAWLGERVPHEFRGVVHFVKTAAVKAFGGYLKAQVILSIVVFVILLIGFFILRQPYALLLAFVLGVMDFIPIIGSGTVMVPWALIDVILGDFKHAVCLMVIWGIIAIFRRVAEPKVVGDHTGLSPIVSLLAIYVGMRIGGVIGMVLGPVICMVVLNVIEGGLFDATVDDLRLAVRDLSAILAGGKKPGGGGPSGGEN